jgi:hypothetical protein
MRLNALALLPSYSIAALVRLSAPKNQTYAFRIKQSIKVEHCQEAQLIPKTVTPNQWHR